MRALAPCLFSLVVGGGALVGCAQRDEIIATLPDGGSGGEGGSGGAGGDPHIPLLPAVAYDVICGAADEVALGDVDGDGSDDLLVAGDCLELRRGGEPLADAETAVTNGFGAAFALGRIDTLAPEATADPLDVIAFAADAVRSYLGDGLGGFSLAMSVPLAGTGHAGDVALAPLYGDGALELITRSASGLAVWSGDGLGGFVGPHAVVADAHAFTVGDFDGDGTRDLLLAADGVRLLRNHGDGMFGAPEIVSAVSAIGTIRAAQLDADDCLDAIAIDGGAGAPAPAGGKLRTFIGDCHGAFEEHTIDLPHARDIAARDLDGDGHVDVVAAVAGAIAVFAGEDGALHPAEMHALASDPHRLAVGDIDGDARLDVVVTLPDVGSVAVLRGN